MTMVHECNWLGCHQVVPAGQVFCEKHKQLHDKQWNQLRDQEAKHQADANYNSTRRDQEANAFYHSRAWTKTRDYVKARDMMTSGLSGKILSDHDYIVDHIVPRRLCKDPYDSNNLWLLSRFEHNRKTKYEEKLPDKVLVTLTVDDWRHRLKDRPFTQKRQNQWQKHTFDKSTHKGFETR